MQLDWSTRLYSLVNQQIDAHQSSSARRGFRRHKSEPPSSGLSQTHDDLSDGPTSQVTSLSTDDQLEQELLASTDGGRYATPNTGSHRKANPTSLTPLNRHKSPLNTTSSTSDSVDRAGSASIEPLTSLDSETTETDATGANLKSNQHAPQSPRTLKSLKPMKQADHTASARSFSKSPLPPISQQTSADNLLSKHSSPLKPGASHSSVDLMATGQSKGPARGALLGDLESDSLSKTLSPKQSKHSKPQTRIDDKADLSESRPASVGSSSTPSSFSIRITSVAPTDQALGEAISDHAAEIVGHRGHTQAPVSDRVPIDSLQESKAQSALGNSDIHSKESVVEPVNLASSAASSSPPMITIDTVAPDSAPLLDATDSNLRSIIRDGAAESEQQTLANSTELVQESDTAIESLSLVPESRETSAQDDHEPLSEFLDTELSHEMVGNYEDVTESHDSEGSSMLGQTRTEHDTIKKKKKKKILRKAHDQAPSIAVQELVVEPADTRPQIPELILPDTDPEDNMQSRSAMLPSCNSLFRSASATSKQAVSEAQRLTELLKEKRRLRAMPNATGMTLYDFNTLH